MLTIRKFATLAGTTRRTLLFYDQVGLFSPVKVADNGYRYYSYDQLYQLKFILQLRQLGLAVNDIKDLLHTTQPGQLRHQLDDVFSHIEAEISKLPLLKQTLAERYQQPELGPVGTLQTPRIVERPALTFWCSPESVGCTDEDVSALYQTFYDVIGPLKLLDKHESGFLTFLPDCSASAYPTANFRILKAASLAGTSPLTPSIQRPAGRYAVATAMNDMTSILHTLDNLQEYVHNQGLTTDPHVWQLNLDEILTSKAGSAYISIETQLI